MGFYLKKLPDGSHVPTQAYYDLVLKTFWRGKIRQHGRRKNGGEKKTGITPNR